MKSGERFHIVRWWPVPSRLEHGRLIYGTYQRHCEICGKAFDPELMGPPFGDNAPKVEPDAEGCSEVRG